MTWLADATGYEVFFNRDESRSRLAARPPALRQRAGVRFIAPEDGDHGGTWIAVNERGLSLCLLNGFASPPPDRAAGSFTSRGLLPLELIDADDAPHAAARLRSRDLGSFRPFVLVAIQPRDASWLAVWSGRDLLFDDRALFDQPVVSSSFSTEEVRQSRRSVFAAMHRLATPDVVSRTHLAFHESHEPDRGPYSPCMHREDARTVSFSWIRVGASESEFWYADHPPCQGRPALPSATLARLP